MQTERGLIMGFGNMGVTQALRMDQLNQSLLVVDPLRSRRKMAADMNVPAYSSLNESVSIEPHPRFVSICTPTNFHFSHIIEVMDFDVPIFVEKPVVRTTEEVKKLRQLAKSYKHPIFVGEVELYNPDLAPFLEYKGKPKHITISRDVDLDFFLHGTKPWFLDEKLSGGIVLDLMIHDITLLIAKYGKPQVGNVVAGSKKYDCIDDVVVDLRFGDITATVHGSWTAEHKEKPVITTIRVEGETPDDDLSVGCDTYGIKGEADAGDAFHREYRAFLNAVKTGKSPYPLDLFLDAVEAANEILDTIH